MATFGTSQNSATTWKMALICAHTEARMVCGICPTAARNVALSVRDIEVGPMKQNYKKTALMSLIFLPSLVTNQWLAVVTLHLVGCVLFFGRVMSSDSQPA